MRRANHITFKVNQIESAHIKRLAASAGLSQSEYLRLVALGLAFAPAPILTSNEPA
jgi:hypothetical protein